MKMYTVSVAAGGDRRDIQVEASSPDKAKSAAVQMANAQSIAEGKNRQFEFRSLKG